METVKTVIDLLFSIYHQLKLVVNEKKIILETKSSIFVKFHRNNHLLLLVD